MPIREMMRGFCHTRLTGLTPAGTAELVKKTAVICHF
jgi:hypothetical protein